MIPSVLGLYMRGLVIVFGMLVALFGFGLINDGALLLHTYFYCWVMLLFV
jgi:hypothetical protein